MKKRKLTVYELSKDLKFKILCNLDNAKKSIINECGVNRAGLELTGSLKNTETISKRVILLGGKESRFLSELKSEEDILSALSYILHSEPPVIIVTKTFDQLEELKKVVEGSKIPILQSTFGSYDTSYFVTSYINTRIWERLEIHATLLSIFGEGVLILGESGIGKSELALGLLKRGHFFIADDRVSLFSDGTDLCGEAANPIATLIEIRGIGIIDVRKMYGFHVVLKEAKVSIIINFIKGTPEDLSNIDRIGNAENNIERYFSHSIHKVTIPVVPGRNLMDLVETAVISLKLKKDGNDPVKELEHLVSNEIKKNRN